MHSGDHLACTPPGAATKVYRDMLDIGPPDAALAYRWCDHHRADLSGADFRGANLTEVTFKGARIDHVNGVSSEAA